MSQKEFSTPLEAFFHNLRIEILLVVWWPEEKQKEAKRYLEGEASRYLQSIVAERESMRTRLRDSMHPLDRASFEPQLIYLGWDIENQRKKIENGMRFAGGSTVLDDRCKSKQAKPKAKDSAYIRMLKKAVGHGFSYPLRKHIIVTAHGANPRLRM
ncbi:hypothetical protein PILCRDRAFT_825439 [Piloderma croceum F 1598]|uniref:Uncharacterized protein n=1 Tax=Piloderma croceum (strain F 1598) TaxID=765440 RepID=A0A0C3ATM5_PILCF|nr:hypothetical protein PILCRDRAFT_825439 [Piloderma croceum F 1598]